MLPIAHLVSVVSFFLSEVNINFVQNGKVINEYCFHKMETFYILTGVVITQVYPSVKSHRSVYTNCFNFVIYELYQIHLTFNK